MKRAKNLFKMITTNDNLFLAFARAKKGHSNKRDVFEFQRYLDSNIRKLCTNLVTGNYLPSPYRTFIIRDPKERTISAPAFRDRVVHHAIMNVCDPVFESFQIYDSYSARRGKGTHTALKRSVEFSSVNSHFLKLDIRKYFDSVDHGVLLSLLQRRFAENRLIRLFEGIVTSYSTAPGKGLPIGSLTSQNLANFYLSFLDHFIKDKLRVRGYVRYMDDFILWADNPWFLERTLKRIIAFLDKNLCLHIKPATINKTRQGIPFLGFLVFPDRIKPLSKKKNRIKQKLEALYTNLHSGTWTQEEFAIHARPLFAQLDYSDSVAFRKKVLSIFEHPPFRAPTVSNVAARGTTTPRTAAVRIATTTHPATRATSSASASSSPSSGG